MKTNQNNLFQRYDTDYAMQNCSQFRHQKLKGKWLSGNHILIMSLFLQHKIEFANLKWPNLK